LDQPNVVATQARQVLADDVRGRIVHPPVDNNDELAAHMGLAQVVGNAALEARQAVGGRPRHHQAADQRGAAQRSDPLRTKAGSSRPCTTTGPGPKSQWASSARSAASR